MEKKTLDRRMSLPIPIIEDRPPKKKFSDSTGYGNLERSKLKIYLFRANVGLSEPCRETVPNERRISHAKISQYASATKFGAEKEGHSVSESGAKENAESHSWHVEILK